MTVCPNLLDWLKVHGHTWLGEKTFWYFCNNLNILKFRQKHLPRFARDSLSQSCWLAPGAQTHLTKKQANKTQPKSKNAPVFFNDRWNAGRIRVKIRRERHLGNLVGQVYDEEKNQIIMIKMWPTIVVSYDLMHNKCSKLETSKDFLFFFSQSFFQFSWLRLQQLIYLILKKSQKKN